MIELLNREMVRSWFAEPASGCTAKTCQAELLDVLRAAAPRLVEQYSLETGYTITDANALLEAALVFLETHDPPTPTSVDTEAPRGHPPMAISRVPWGRVIIALPSNAVLPLAVILGLCFAQAGNKVVLSAPRNGRGTMELVAACFARVGCHLAWYSAGTRDLVDACLAGREIDCLYFIGSSSQYADIAARCAAVGIELIYEGEGRGAMVVDASLSDDHVRSAAACLFDSKRMWSGRMCSAPNFVLVARENAAVFVDEFDRLAKAVEPCGVPAALSPACSRFLESCLREGARSVPAQSNVEAMRAPVLVWCDDAPTDWTQAEMFGPATLGATYNDEGELLRTLTQSRYGLQLTVFTTDHALLMRLVAAARVARVCVNMLPVNQDPGFAWGAYGLSGRSDVCTFAEKAYRKVLVECWGRPPGLPAIGATTC